jgi:hypothetical protein
VYKKADTQLDFMDVEETGHLKTALDALRQLIVEKLDSDKRTRFSSVANLCEVAKSLLRAEAKPRVPKKRPGDIGVNVFEEDEGENEIGYINGIEGAVMYDGNIAMGEPMRYMDPRQQSRNIKVQMDSLSQVTIAGQRAQMAAAEAQELKDLLTVRDVMGAPGKKEVIDARVSKLFSNMKERNQDVEMVHSKLPRGSATGSDQSDGDRTPHVQPIERGDDRDGGIPEEGSEGRDGLQAVGNT